MNADGRTDLIGGDIRDTEIAKLLSCNSHKLRSLLHIISVTDAELVFAAVGERLKNVLPEHVSNLEHRFFAATGNAGGENFSFLQSDQRLYAEKRAGKPGKLADASAVPQIVEVAHGEKDAAGAADGKKTCDAKPASRMRQASST